MEKRFLQGIDTVILRVSNVLASKTWYTDKLGFKSIHEDDLLKLIVLDTDSPTSLTIWQTDEPITPNAKTSTYPIFRTMNAKEAHHELKTRGVQVGDLVTDHVVTYFTFFDPDRNILEACQVHG